MITDGECCLSYWMDGKGGKIFVNDLRASLGHSRHFITELVVGGLKILCIDNVTPYPLHLGLITLKDGLLLTGEVYFCLVLGHFH